MPDDKTTLERISALEQKVSTEQAMRVALLTDITARIDMLEHRAGDVPPADPASEAPLTRAEAEEIAKTCARAAAALPEAPSYLTTVNMRGWRPHAWVVDAVVNGAYRSRIGQGDMKVALSELTDALKRDQNATCVRIAKIVGVYHADYDDDDGYDLDGLLGVLEANMAKLRKDASGACDAQRAAMANRDELRDQRDAMRAERDQALARVRELEDSREALCERVLDVEGSGQDEINHLRRLASTLEQQVADAAIQTEALRDDLRRERHARSEEAGAAEKYIIALEQRLAKASADTVQAMESAAALAARVQELEAQIRGMHHRLCDATGSNRADTHDVVIGSISARWELLERDNQALRERYDQLFAGAQFADRNRANMHQQLMDLRHRVSETLGVSYEHDEALLAAIAKLKAESIADVMAKLESLRGQVANMHADQMWLKRCEEMEVQLGGSLGIARENVPSWYALIDQVRELKARASGGVAHE